MMEYYKRSKDDAKKVEFEKELLDEKLISGSDSEYDSFYDFLEKEYSYIYHAMNDEEYEMEESVCEIFQEIVFDERVVGFYTYEYLSDFEDRMCINEFYVLPEYRGNKIFINTLMSLIRVNDYDGVLLRRPSRLIIDILIENGLATRFSKNLVRTGIKLAVRLSKIIKTKKLGKLYLNLPDDVSQISYLGNVYDTNTCSIVFNDSAGIIALYDDIVLLSYPRRLDYQKYHLSKKIRKVDRRYVKKVFKEIINSYDELEEFQKSVDTKFGKSKGIGFYFGSIEEPSFLVEEEIKNGHLTRESFISIREKIQQALDENELLEEDILTRFDYLVAYPEKEALVTGKVKSGHCPYCNGLSFEEGICVYCGYNLFDKKIERIRQELDEKVDPQTGAYYSLLETISEKGYDKESVINNQVEISACQLLNFINQLNDYSSLPDFDDNNQISEEKYVQFLVERGFIELKENTNKNDEKEFLEMLRESGGIPSTRAYKAHMHRDYMYKITKKGKRFFTQNKIANFYMENIINLPYYEFKKFYKENKDKLDEVELLNEFVNNIENEVIERQDIEQYNNVCLTRINIIQKDDDEELLLTAMIKSLICRLNYFQLSLDNMDFIESPIDSYNEVFIMQYADLIGNYDYEKLFTRAYESIALDKLKINKEEIYEDIDDLLSSGNVGQMNRILQERYNEL